MLNPELPPQTLLHKRYQIERTLKIGGMGAIYLGRDQTLGNSLCAIKQMHNLGDDNDEYLRNRFEAEMFILAKLQHPHIPRVRDYFQQDGGLFLIMDFIDGESLDDELHRQRSQPTFQPRPTREIIEDALAILDVIQWMHRQNPPILHRDIKPANILRERQTGHIKIVDFGLARSIQPQTPGTTVGTLGYSSLEQLAGEPSTVSDLYSIGVTLHEMLTGHRPQLGKLHPLNPQTWQAYDAQLADIVEKSTQQNPHDRYQTAQEMADQLKHCINPNHTPPPPTPQADTPHYQIQQQPPEPVAEPREIATAPTQLQPPAQETKKRPWAAISLISLLILLPIVHKNKNRRHVAPPKLAAGSIFSVDRTSKPPNITIGEDISLFQPNPLKDDATAIAERLNRLYEVKCGSCDEDLLQPNSVMVGHHDTDTVVFYGHLHDGQFVSGPETLATIDAATADSYQTTPSFLAAYWRDILRDIIAISRGEKSKGSSLGEEFSTVLEKAAQGQPSRQPSIATLRAVLRNLNNKKIQKLRKAFIQMPDNYRYQPDQFPVTDGYSPLKG